MEGFENNMLSDKNASVETMDSNRSKADIRARRKRTFVFVLIFLILVSCPVARALAASINLGIILDSDPVNPKSFDSAPYIDSQLHPGDTITWGIGDNSDDPGRFNYVVKYKVSDQIYTDNVNVPAPERSGDTLSYTVRSLASVSEGADTRTVAYWTLTEAHLSSDPDVYNNNSTLDQIVLTAHFAAAPVPPKGKTNEVLTLVGGGEDKGPQLPPHEHAYTWIKTRETTEEVDGEWSYKCECGDVKYRIPESGAFAFIRNAIDNINKTPQGGTVEIKTRRWLVFNKAVADAISDRPDVTIKLSYLEGGYKGDGLTTTLPAGTDLHQYLDEKGYVGFLYLKTIFPTERTLWNK